MSKAYRGVMKARVKKLFSGKVTVGKAKKIDGIISAMPMKKIKRSPALKKLSASCKAAAKRKFKVYPSAYANMWAAKTQSQGKC